uniref:Uncharacterized protein n=1 Tax=Timema tahoe TaxID=61484 RepID=A0A7R9NWJ5_9NEOP|nr:unnamed protein product [Timema tahoe]
MFDHPASKAVIALQRIKSNRMKPPLGLRKKVPAWNQNKLKMTRTRVKKVSRQYFIIGSMLGVSLALRPNPAAFFLCGGLGFVDSCGAVLFYFWKQGRRRWNAVSSLIHGRPPLPLTHTKKDGETVTEAAPAIDNWKEVIPDPAISYVDFVSVDEDVAVCGEVTNADIVTEVLNNNIQAENGASGDEEDNSSLVQERWVPYTKAPNVCELNCMPRGERFYYRHKRKVVDGTRCDDEKLDICVDGQCLVEKVW